LHADQSLSALAEAVAARTGRPMGVVLRLFLEARDAGKGVTADRDARDLETVGELAALLEESRELQRTLRGDRSPRKIVRTL
jgi:hypothetical protein